MNQAVTPLLSAGIVRAIIDSLRLSSSSGGKGGASVAAKPMHQLLQVLSNLFSASSVASQLLHESSSEDDGMQVFDKPLTIMTDEALYKSMPAGQGRRSFILTPARGALSAECLYSSMLNMEVVCI